MDKQEARYKSGSSQRPSFLLYDFNWRDYLISLLPISVALIAVALQLWGWPEKWDTFLHRAVALGLAVFLSFGAQFYWSRWQRIDQYRTARRSGLNTFLDKCLAQTIIDPEGELNARLSVMTPHWGFRVFWDARANPRWRLEKLYPVACSRNMSSAPDIGLPWSRGNGCVGEVWASRDHYATACIDSEERQKDFIMSEVQRRTTRSLRCIISVAIFKGIGVRQRLLGFLNVDSTNEAAIERWTNRNQVAPDLAALVTQISEVIAERDYLV